MGIQCGPWLALFPDLPASSFWYTTSDQKLEVGRPGSEASLRLYLTRGFEIQFEIDYNKMLWSETSNNAARFTN